ncbi:cob(I)yrinic acid a,c-diamide adenosyltransferase [Chitinasiproducens palmae]|uniref:Cobalamin adenosyltransferase n=1 Tax=Chitinasiproducens palmae TaxID=1770053 RepID=A0A1H2PRF7_9BURK|nr:cob(I)yrinic acid a,c-diamide adenosyltransferase [Chitinasiproducens palmae]SDV49473.1 ATP:cob(I)alamin adenosyltransferase [Chitinasiproducens palmae]
MGNRLSRITTRTGDDGTTGLADGSRLRKDAPRIAAIGEVDELNSTLGVLLAEPLPNAVADVLAPVQHELFDLGGALSMPGVGVFDTSALLRLDAAIADINATLPPLAEFILPGGSRSIALAHVCRTVCRRAERVLVTLCDGAPAEGPEAAGRRYLNRLSDLLFVLARAIGRDAGVPSIAWRNPHRR